MVKSKTTKSRVLEDSSDKVCHRKEQETFKKKKKHKHKNTRYELNFKHSSAVVSSESGAADTNYNLLPATQCSSLLTSSKDSAKGENNCLNQEDHHDDSEEDLLSVHDIFHESYYDESEDYQSSGHSDSSFLEEECERSHFNKDKRDDEENQMLVADLQHKLKLGRHFINGLKNVLEDENAKTKDLEGLLRKHQYEYEELLVERQNLEQQLVNLKIVKAVYSPGKHVFCTPASQENTVDEFHDTSNGDTPDFQNRNWKIARYVDNVTRVKIKYPNIPERDYLFDAAGYCYGQFTDDADEWVCIKNQRSNNCLVVKCGAKGVIEEDEFILTKPHRCKFVRNQEAFMRLDHRIVKIWMEDPFAVTSKTETIRKAIRQLIMEDPNFPVLFPTMKHYWERLIGLWESFCPAHPNDLSFSINPNFLVNDILKADIIVERDESKRRHLIFASKEQFEILRSAEVWCLYVTSAHVEHPFKQTLVIGTFTDTQNIFCTFPLLFVVMSSATPDDYNLIFDKLRELLRGGQKVKEIHFNLETYVVQSIKASFPTVILRQPSYMWFTDLVRALKMCDLGYLFRSNETFERYCWRLFSLNLLPQTKIPKMFDILKRKFSSIDMGSHVANFAKFISYVETTWIDNPTRPLEMWCCYGGLVTTRRIIERLWLNRFGKRYVYFKTVKSNFYDLMFFMQNQVKLLASQNFLIRRKKVYKYQKEPFNRYHFNFEFKVISLWTSYRHNFISTTKMLKGFAMIQNERTGALQSKFRLDDDSDDPLLCNPEFLK